jgi:pimeloyl-ACP methyl ester carboxylesterase
MDVWDIEFCRLLVAGGRYVIRYDQRDTGRATHFPAGSPPYGFDDLVADAAGLLKGLGVPRAHLVGASMGGAVAQRLALEHSHLVASLTLIATSPGLRPHEAPYPDLPAMSAELEAQFTGPSAGPPHNHWLIDGGPAYRDRLGTITLDTLVIHGTEDPLFPFGHAQALVQEIPGAQLLPMPGIGHQPPPPQTWPEVVPAILRHTDAPAPH